jgi:hypothetical protein
MLTEPHYTVKRIAEMWTMSQAAIRRLFRDEPGVLRFGKEKRGHQRDYVTLRIPASVAERVYRRMMRPGFVTSADQDRMKAAR